MCRTFFLFQAFLSYSSGLAQSSKAQRSSFNSLAHISAAPYFTPLACLDCFRVASASP
jgi:hypothetical protein